MSHPVIASALPVQVRTPQWHLWFLRDRTWLDFLPCLQQYLAAPASARPAEVVVLKSGVRREVLRWSLAAGGNGLPATVVVKCFPVTSLKMGLYSWRRYAPAETANLLEAARRDLPTPRVFMYGEVRRHFLVRSTTIVMQDFAGLVPLAGPLGAAAARGQDPQPWLDAVADLLLKLYRAGCNHIDLNPLNLLVHPADPRELRLIDFHYVRYQAAPSLNILAFHLGYFSAGAREWIADERLARWAETVLQRAGAPDPTAARQQFRVYRDARLSRQERLRLR